MYRYRRAASEGQLRSGYGDDRHRWRLALTGILKIEFDLTPLDTNPQAVIVAIVFSLLAGLLLYEW